MKAALPRVLLRHLVSVSLLAATAAGLAGCEAGSAVTAAELRAHVSYLASDELAGRQVGTPGVALAEEYVAAEFARCRLAPLPGRKDYYLDFRLHRWSYDERRTRLTFMMAADAGRAEIAIPARLGVDFRPFWFSQLAAVEAPVVFAGYGITAPEYGWDDYAGLDVRGKIALVLRHEPRRGDPPRPLGGEGYSRHALFVTKARNALAHGAVGMLLFTDPASVGGGADDLRADGTLSLRRQPPQPSRSEGIPIVAAHIGQELASRLVEPAGYSLLGLQQAVDSGEPPRNIPFPALRAALSVGSAAEPAGEVSARNVAGLLRGSDARLAGEWIVIGAHHDHLGSLPSGQGDRIFNGADDNASGVAAILELAEMFAARRPALPRSLAFITFSGEEEGLFGSEALFELGLVPTERVAFMLNLDMIGRNPEKPLAVFGTGLDEGLQSRIQASAEALDLQVSLEGQGPRHADSDYGPFAKAGIPFVCLFTGEHPDYHEPSDEADRLAYKRMEQIVRLAAELIEELARRPRLR